MSLQPHLLNTAAFGLAIFLLGIALHGRQRLRSTTLAAPCLWVAISALCMMAFAVSRVFHRDENQSLGMAAMQFAVAATTLCPLVAVLGAKRPQHRGWQWVVFTLWLIVIWPAVQTVLHPAGPRLEIFQAWQLFLWALAAMGPLNYLATRFWFASFLVAAGQLILFGEYVGLPVPHLWQLPLGVACFLVASIVIAMRRPAGVASDQPLAEQSRRWLHFRNAFGAFWALRIMQRVNEAAALRNWPVQLTWTGFETVSDEEIKPVHLAEINQTLDTLLRRFL